MEQAEAVAGIRLQEQEVVVPSVEVVPLLQATSLVQLLVQVLASPEAA